MKRLRAQIQYTEQPTEFIYSKNAEALEAIHAFLRFQIAKHRTKDSSDVVH